MRSRAKGFTLIELLVVIAIIAILAAILFPVFAKAQEKARQSACMSNVKQLGLGLLQYVQDYDESFPPSWGAAGDNNLGERWPHMIMPYVKSHSLFQCPSTDDKVLPDLTVRDILEGGTQNYDGNYGINYDGIGYWANSSLALITEPAAMFMLGDSGESMACCWGANTWAQLMNNLDIDRASARVEGANRHNHGAVWSYVDGHVKWITLDELVRRDGHGSAPWFINWDDNPPADNGVVPYPNRN